VPPDGLTLPSLTPPPLSSRTRRLSLTEHDSATLPGVGPAAGLLGIVGSGGAPVPKRWEEQITEMPSVGATETWELFNTTEDAHPIHLHLVQFQILNRQQLATDSSGALAMPLHPAGSPMKPESWETGTKDTIIAYPGQVARVRATFDMPGLFVWHCHILEHEDHEMMRPYMVG
jgi:bilirubin oxidase